jgi:putative aldouronate transport system substrate-binding protein
LFQIGEILISTNPDNAYINKSWLDKLGLKVPSTTAEFENALRAFRDGDPNGNGRRDEIPFSFADRGGDLSNIYSFYGIFGMRDNGDHIMVNNGKVYFTANTPQWRAATEWFRKLYSERLIDQECFTHDGAKFNAKGAEPDSLYGVFIAWFDENVAGTARAQNDYVALPPLMGVDGKQRWNWAPHMLNRDRFVITNKMKHPEVAIRWADLCYDVDHSFELLWGPIGLVLNKAPDGTISVNPPPAGQTADDFRYAHSPAVSTPLALFAADLEKYVWETRQIRKFERYDMYSKFFPAFEEIYPRVYFTPEENSELAVLRTDVRDYVNQMKAKFIVGSEPLDNAAWNSYVQTVGRAGVDKYLAIYQAALDRYNGK